jgi:hypothetical protein
MKQWVAILFFAAAFGLRAQTIVTPYQALHPIMKDPHQRNAPTSLNQYPGELTSPAAPAAVLMAPAKPPVIVARIDSGLAASAISLIGTVDGLKGRLYVTNIGSADVTPLAQFVVCDPKGFQVGTASQKGSLLSPNESERMEIVATNLNAVDLKLLKLSGKK